MDIAKALTSAVPGILTIAAILTAPVAFVLITLYRRAVIRLMSKRAQPARANPTALEDPKPRSSGLTTKLELAFLDKPPALKNKTVISLYTNLRTRHWQAAAIYTIGGICFASVLSVGTIVAQNIEITPLRFLYNALIYFWPTVLVVNLVASLERRDSSLIFAGYFFLWLVITAIATLRNPALTWRQCIEAWIILSWLPTLIVMLFLYRQIRAVGPLVFTFLAFGLSGLFLDYLGGMLEIDFIVKAEGPARLFFSRLFDLGMDPYDIALLLLISSILFMTVLGWLALQLLKWLYVHKRQSDQSLIVDPIWFIFGYFASASLFFGNPWCILTGFAAFAFYKIVIWIGFYFLNRNRKKIEGPKLLLLRVFSLGQRSEQLYRAIAKAWRYVGNIRFITGPDLATSTVEPHNFLDYISGRLRHHFIDSAATLERRINDSDELPDLDGRYRVHDFFCYDDTWKMVLSRLAKDSDAILMDLRKFCRTNAGCVFEINELVNSVPLKRVVFVIDKTTDEAFLRESIENAWTRLSADSPNREQCTKVHLLNFEETRPNPFSQLLYALSVAATSS